MISKWSGMDSFKRSLVQRRCYHHRLNSKRSNRNLSCWFSVWPPKFGYQTPLCIQTFQKKTTIFWIFSIKIFYKLFHQKIRRSNALLWAFRFRVDQNSLANAPKAPSSRTPRTKCGLQIRWNIFKNLLIHSIKRRAITGLIKALNEQMRKPNEKPHRKQKEISLISRFIFMKRLREKRYQLGLPFFLNRCCATA